MQQKISYYIIIFLKHSMVHNKKSTYTNYRYIIYKHINQYWSNYYVYEINDIIVIKYIEALYKLELKPKTIKDILAILKGIFKLAQIEVKIPTPHINKPIIKIINNEDLELLENELIKNINYINFSIYLSLYTGIRIGELCALKYSDINFYNRTILINKTMSRVYDNESNHTKISIDSPKTYTSIREIPIPPFLFKYLRLLKFNENDYILTGSNKYMQPRTLSYKYKKILKRLNIDNYTFHSLRHTFATNCIKIGADVKTLSLLLGHKSVEITLNRYIHPDINEKYKIITSLKPINEKYYNIQTLKKQG